MATIAALVFDVDGTLADTEKDGHRIAFNRAFDDAGLDWDWSVEMYGNLLAVTGGKERIKYYLNDFNTEYQAPENLDEFVAGLHAAKTDHYKALMAQGKIPLREGVEALVLEARAAGLPMAIATTTTLDNVTALVSSTLGVEALDWFAVIGAGDIVPKKKPAPDIFSWVLEQLDVAGEQVIVFEDSGHGVTSASDAGIDRIVVTTNDYTVNQDFSRATVVLDGMGDANAKANAVVGQGPKQLVDIAYLQSL